MPNNIRMLHAYIGANSSILLNDEPFKNYKFDITIEQDLPDELRIYACEREGFEFQCDSDDCITTIFVMRKNELANSDRLEVRSDWSMHLVRDRLGKPDRTGTLWDRFDYETYALHVSYGQDQLVEMVTLMRDDVVPTCPLTST